jgi:hypothetical protein
VKKSIFTITIIVFMSWLAVAENTKYELDGFDITPAVEYFQKMVHPLKQIIYVYHWNPNGEARGDGPEIFNMVKNNANTFWSMYGDPQTVSGGMYGRGLYAAADPIHSYGFGGGPEKWFLLQMALPVGFRLLDIAAETSWVASNNKKTISEEMKNIASQFHCDALNNVDSLFADGAYKISQQCQNLARKIFKEILKIDGFAYFYGQTSFKDCQSDNYVLGNRAIVITENTWMTTENIKYFTQKSKHSLEDRIRIETLFYKKIDANVKLSDSSIEAIAEYLQIHETKEMIGSKSVCSNTTCTIVVRFCDSQNVCDEVSLAPLPRPSGPLFTEVSAKNTEPGRLLWPDLEGKAKADNVSEWLKKQMFGCNGELPYPVEKAEEANKSVK